MSPQDAAQHIFFISARETLDQCDIANRSPGRAVPGDGWQSRVQEFANFERKFEVNCYYSLSCCCKNNDICSYIMKRGMKCQNKIW